MKVYNILVTMSAIMPVVGQKLLLFLMTFSSYNRSATEKMTPYRVRAKHDLGIHQSAKEIGGVASGGTNASATVQSVSVPTHWTGSSTRELAADMIRQITQQGLVVRVTVNRWRQRLRCLRLKRVPRKSSQPSLLFCNNLLGWRTWRYLAVWPDP